MKKYILGLILALGFFIRFYHLSSVPLSLSWDEASLGYNAFAIATTFRDEHGEFMPVARFTAFGDYKPPGYIYVAVPAVKLLGLSEFSTRLPSALAGTLLILVAYFLAKEIGRTSSFFAPSSRNLQFGLLAAFLIAISPWAIHFSHAAFESNLATFFTATGTLCFLVANRKRPLLFLLLSSLFFAFATYTFNTHRVFIPLLLGGLSLIFLKTILKRWKFFLVAYGFLFLLVLPQLPFVMSQEGKLRFNEVAWVNDLEPIEQSNTRIMSDNSSLEGRILHNRRVVYTLEFVTHYLDGLNPNFLFGSGDVNPRLSVQAVGEMYLFELPFLLVGIFALAKFGGKGARVLLVWAILAPIPGAFARETPHALRSLNLLPLPQLIVAAGALYTWQKVKAFDRLKVVLAAFSGVVVSLSLLLYLYEFFVTYPVATALEWQYGYKEMVGKVQKLQPQYDSVIITETYGRPYIYLLFHQGYDAKKYSQTREANRDWYGFWYVKGFDKYHFGSSDQMGSGKRLFVLGPNESVANAKVVDTIRTPDGKPVFVLSEK